MKQGDGKTLCLMIILHNKTTRQILGLGNFEADPFEKKKRYEGRILYYIEFKIN